MQFRDILMVAATQGGDAASIYSDEANDLFARMSVQPDETRKGHIDTLIRALLSSGAWDIFDGFYNYAAHDAQAARLNWKSASFDCTAVNSPTFTIDRGYTGDGATSYLNPAFNPTSAAGNYTQNSAHMSVWSGTDVNSSAQMDIGFAGLARICTRNGANVTTRSNAGTSADTALGVATSVGWTCWSRSAGASFEVQKNGDIIGSPAIASLGIPNGNFYILAVDGGASPSNFSTRRIQAASFGGAMNETIRDAVYSALSTYMTAVGA